jgi:glucose/arabinose dehydrogenase
MRLRRGAARLALGALVVAGAGLLAPTAAPARQAGGGAPAVGATAASTDPRRVGVRFVQVASGLQQPVGLAAPDDDSGRLFVIERRGTIRYYRDGRLSGLYLDLRARVHDSGGEQGLLGIAFHPSFRSKPYLYVAYTASNGELRVTRFRASSAGATTVNPATGLNILTIAHPGGTNHNGGQLAFNRDGYLYIGTGDGGGTGDPPNNAQNRTRLLGKILRIDIDRWCGSRHYCSPTSNPYHGHPTFRPEIWLYGLRNPWRFSFDRDYGNLWIGDVGQSRREEVDRVPVGTGGWNLGWSCREGSLVYDSSRCRSGVTYHGPTREYGRDQGGTVIGGFVYRGSRYPILRHIYVYGDFVSGRVWGYRRGVANAQMASFPGGGFNLVSFGESYRRNLYAVGYDGRLFLVAAFSR